MATTLLSLRKVRSVLKTLTVALALTAPLTTISYATELRIGLAEVNAFLDPHFQTSPSSFNVNSHIFEQLFRRDNEARPQPWLAESLEKVDDLHWLVHLRKDVKWTDGSPFIADDVVFSLNRGIKGVQGSISTFRTYLRQIAKSEVVDAHTVRITTTEPAPFLIDGLTYFLIVSKKHGESATTADYNSGKAVIGTGPYKLVSWTNGVSTVLEANPNYWGEKPHWSRIIFKGISSGPSRVAALRAGDVDVIEAVPSEDIEAIKKDPNLRVWSILTGRVAYFSIDIPNALKSGKLTGINGETLDKNPLADPRVRQAMKEAVDVKAIVKRIYAGEAEATAQYFPEGFEGYNPDIKFSGSGGVEKARQLLKDAGWYNKFKLEIATATGFFPKSTQLAEALAQSWTQAGIPTSVAAMPFQVYLKSRREHKLLITASAYLNTPKKASSFFPTLLHTRDVKRGQGTLNLIGYSNPKFDKLVDEAMSSFDSAKRTKLFAEATKIALDDNVLVPMLFIYSVHGSNKNFVVKMRADKYLRGDNIFPAKN